ncbi:hypothetical protein Tco_0454435 [Tanacetum coccineum]
MYSCEFCFGIDAVMALFYTKEGRRKANCGKEQAAKDQYWKIHICYDDDEDYTIAITPILSTKEPVNSLSMGDEHLDTIPIVIPEVGGINTDILLTIKDDILHEKLLNVNLLIANIEALKDNPAPSYDVMTKSSSTSLNLFLEETNTFNNSLTESFYFDLEENSSGSTTTYSDYSLPDYEAFYSDDDHIKENSSDSTTTHADFSKYDSFIFDLSINPFPPADRSNFYHEEFADELAHIISPPEYDHFCFKIEPELGNLTMDVVEDIFPTREPRVHVPNVLTTHPTLEYRCSPYFSPVGNEDTIFGDPVASPFIILLLLVVVRRLASTFSMFCVSYDCPEYQIFEAISCSWYLSYRSSRASQCTSASFGNPAILNLTT